MVTKRIPVMLGALFFSGAWAFPIAPFEIDSAKAFAASTFPIKPDDLIVRAKEILSEEINLGLNDGGECLTDNFQFCAATFGPYGKEEYLELLQSLKLQDTFDITQNMFGFTVSPVQPNRVYFFDHSVAKLKANFFGVKPEQIKDNLVLPPQCLHLDFDDHGKVTGFGHYVVDRQYGNTGGLGGAFGYFYGVGQPLPYREARPFKPSLMQKFFNGLFRVMSARAKKKSKNE